MRKSSKPAAEPASEESTAVTPAPETTASSESTAAAATNAGSGTGTGSSVATDTGTGTDAGSGTGTGSHAATGVETGTATPVTTKRTNSSAPAPAAAKTEDAEPDVSSKKRKKKDNKSGRTRSTMKEHVNKLRTRIATLVWLAAVVCALFLAVGALLVALKMNPDNSIISFINDGAKNLDLGTFKDFKGNDSVIKDRLTNWGIAAVIYLIVGKVLDRIIRP